MQRTPLALTGHGRILRLDEGHAGGAVKSLEGQRRLEMGKQE
ncbi:MAG TPA: hypothetical protein VMS99_08680 [Acidimicrobiia bacterium]|nr:hypothetical protein [Acidimicrobiia bacterium]